MSSSKNPEIWSDDPIVLKSMVGKQVFIKTVDDNTHSGIIYVIDPIFKNVVLLTDDKIKIILYHAIKNVEFQFGGIYDLNIATFPSATVCESAEDAKNKESLKKWLQHMYLEVEDYGGGLKVGEHLTITAPYTRDSCFSDNTIILEKIQKIIDVMPANYPGCFNLTGML